MSTDQQAVGDGSAPETRLHDILANERRRRVLEHLHDSEEPVTVRELSEQVAAEEHGSETAPRDVRKSVYVSLRQHHLTKLEDAEVIEFDEDDNRVELAENASQLDRFLSDEERSPDPPHVELLGVVVVGIATTGCSSLGVWPFALLAAELWALGALCVIGAIVLGSYADWSVPFGSAPQ